MRVSLLATLCAKRRSPRGETTAGGKAPWWPIGDPTHWCHFVTGGSDFMYGAAPPVKHERCQHSSKDQVSKNLERLVWHLELREHEPPD